MKYDSEEKHRPFIPLESYSGQQQHSHVMTIPQPTTISFGFDIIDLLPKYDYNWIHRPSAAHLR